MEGRRAQGFFGLFLELGALLTGNLMYKSLQNWQSFLAQNVAGCDMYRDRGINIY